MNNCSTLLPVIAFTTMVSGCLAPTVPAEVCKSNIVRSTQAFMNTPSSNRYFEDGTAAYREFDRLVNALVTSIDEENCRQETVRAVNGLKFTAQKLHDAVVEYEESSAGSPARSAAERQIYRLIDELGMSFAEIGNS